MLTSVAPAKWSRLTLVSGDEELLVTRAIAAVVAGAREVDPGVEVREIPAGQFTEADVFDATSPSMFGDTRVLVVRGGQDLTEEVRDALLTLVADPPPDLVLVVCHAGGNKNKKLLDGLKAAKAVVVVAAKVSKRAELLAFLSAELAAADRRISEDGRVALLETVGSDLRELSAACAQLVADTAGPLDAATVARFHRGRADTKGYEVAEATLSGDLPEALARLAAGLDSGLAAVLVTSAVATGLRELVRVSGEQGGGWDVAKRLGMPEWKVEKLRRQARGWSEDGLAAALQATSAADGGVKGAGVDPAYVVQALILEVVGHRQTTTGVGASAAAGGRR